MQYLPDGGPAAPLYTMLCEALVKRGHAVTVIAGVPHYPSGRIPAAFRDWRVKTMMENGVQIIRVPLPSVNRSNLALRLLQIVCYQVGAALAGLCQKYEVLLASNPALEVGLPYVLLTILRRKPAVFSVHDLYPDAGIALGIFRHRAVIAMVAALERFCLDHSVHVRILSESFASGLTALGTPADKLALIYDWVDTGLVQPLPRQNSFSNEYKLDGYFVVLYAGNLGLSQGLGTVLETARMLADRPEILFLFVGDGAGKEGLVGQASELNNVWFLPFQPRERLPEVLASADLSLVILKRGIGANSLPSKTFSILSSARPVMACVDEGSDTWRLVKRSRSGCCVLPEEPAALAEAILAMKMDPAQSQQMGRNGRAWIEKYHSPQVAAEQFERLLVSAIDNGKR